MPAVVRGGRRQGSSNGSRRGAKGSRNAAAVPAKTAAIGRLDLSPRMVGAAFAGGAILIAALLLAGGGAARIAESARQTTDRASVAMGFGLQRVHITGASDEATPAIRQALDLSAGQPITRLDLNELRARVEAVGWVRSARVVRLLPGALMVEVVEHDRLAVWRDGMRWHVIDGQGQVIEGADARLHAELPLVVGLGAADAAPEILPMLRERPRLSSRLEALVRVDERRWDLRLKDGSVILLPATNEEAALIQLDALDQRERLLDLGFSRVDLRTPQAVAVRAGGAA